jgi:flagellar M-ring protein FliF
LAQFNHIWDNLRGWWQTATPATRAMATGMVLLIVVGLIVAGSLATSPDYQAIYHGVSGKDAAAMETVLHGHAIDMRYDDKEQTVSVPAKDESNATMYVAAAGILSQDSVADGTETQDVPISPMDSPDVVTQKQNTAKEVAMDRKLMRLDPIAAAAVSISAGTATTLFGNDTAPTASVILTMKPGETLNSLQVKGIINLVAHAVTGLTPDNVTLTDQSGMPLGQADDTGDPGLPGGEDAKASEAARKSIQDLLDRTVGLHKAIVTVHAELNLDQTSTDSIQHTPLAGTKTGMPVSVRTKEEDYSGGGAGAPPVGGISGSGGNLNVPSYTTGGSGSSGGKYANTDTTTNYDNDVTHTKTIVAPGSIKKETVTALVDTSVPPATVALLKDSIATAIGATPGDTTRFVTVQQFAFDTSAQKAESAQMQSLASQQLYSNIARALAVAVVAIVLLVLLTRSGRRSSQPQLALAGGGANIGHLEEGYDNELGSLLDRTGAHGSHHDMNHMMEDRPLTVEDVLAEMPEPESRPRRSRQRVQSIEEQQDMKMESIRTMVEGHPESVALLLKGWMADDIKVTV